MNKTDKKRIDMAWGSPAFLSPYWEKNKIKTDHIKKSKNYEYGSRKNLKKLIIKLHKKVKNAEVKNKHIVVAAGASQILLALFFVLKENKKFAWAEPPHFSRFPVLAKMAKLNWKKSEKSIKIISNPNNPDSLIRDETKCDILDACYNWPQYTDVTKYDHPVMVFSLSKATGHASTRIGWVILEDESLAKKLTEFIELSTGGLSIEAQTNAEEIIRHQLKTNQTVFDYGRKILKIRWDKVKKIKKSFETLNESGMFIWAKGKCPDNINSINGILLGSSEDYFRLNIGCSNTSFNRFIKTIKKS